jgi:predicted RNA binding protein YcfA (HicA-like mRNA interferase family)
MPRLPRWTAAEAERALLEAGFLFLRSKGCRRIYLTGARRIALPFHSGVVLHSKIMQQVLEAIEETRD